MKLYRHLILILIVAICGTEVSPRVIASEPSKPTGLVECEVPINLKLYYQQHYGNQAYILPAYCGKQPLREMKVGEVNTLYPYRTFKIRLQPGNEIQVEEWGINGDLQNSPYKVTMENGVIKWHPRPPFGDPFLIPERKVGENSKPSLGSQYLGLALRGLSGGQEDRKPALEKAR